MHKSEKRKKLDFKFGMSRTSNNKVSFEIEDAMSGNTIIEAEIGLEEFAYLVTGRFGVEATGVLYDTTNVGKKRVTKHVSCEKPDYRLTENEKKQHIIRDFYENHVRNGWSIFSDGTSTQQRTDKHVYVLIKYVDEESESDVKPEN